MNKTQQLLLMGLICCSTSFAQSTEGKEKKAPNCWHQMDKTDSGYNGISLAKAYDFIKTKKLKSKKAILFGIAPQTNEGFVLDFSEKKDNFEYKLGRKLALERAEIAYEQYLIKCNKRSGAV